MPAGMMGDIKEQTSGADSAMNYAFWSSKGGVGKTFLCFAAASEFALRNPETSVTVCFSPVPPQSRCRHSSAPSALWGKNRHPTGCAQA